MANWFEDLTKTVADEKLSRRQAVGRIAGVVAGGTIVAWLPEQALAKNIPWKKQCLNGSNCDVPPMNCNGNPNTNCCCMTEISDTPVCGCNIYCSQSTPCTSSSNCKRGYVCVTATPCTGCGTSYGVCVPKCKGEHKNCQLGDGQGSTTAPSLS